MKLRLWIVVMGFSATIACKTSQSKKDAETQATKGNASLVGTFDDGGKAIIPMPKDLGAAPAVPPKTSARTTSKPKGLGLSEDTAEADPGFKGKKAPKNSSLGANVVSDCWSQDSKLDGSNWFFYAELYQGEDVVGQTETPLNQCSDIQLTLVRLTTSQKYSVKASIFYRSGNQTIIWYQSKTMKPFKAEEKGRQIVLEKVIVDQNVSVVVADTDREKCAKQGYVWDGSGCINSPQWIGFKYTDNSTPGSPATFKLMKCLKSDASGSKIQSCDFGDDKQVFQFKFAYFGRKEMAAAGPTTGGFKSEDISWFTILVGTGSDAANKTPTASNKCLTVNDNAKPMTMSTQSCLTDPEGNADNSQLFALEPSTAADRVGYGSYRLITMQETAGSKENQCLGVKLHNNELPRNDGAPALLFGCNSSSADQKKSQFLRLLTREEYADQK